MDASDLQQPSKLKQQFDVLRRVESFMSTLSDLDQLLEQIMQESQQVTDAEASSLALYDESDDEFVFEIVLGDKGDETKKHRVKSGEGIIGQVGKTGRPKNIKDAYADKNFAARLDQSTGFKTRNILAVPMLRRGRLIGVIEVLNKKGGKSFTDEDQSIMELLAHQAAIAIENARLYRDNLAQAHLASLGEGISGAAHCIKNIVGILTMGSSSLEYGIKNGDMTMVRNSWGPLQRGCNRISDLVMDMLSYAKDRVPEHSAVDLNALIEDIIEIMQPKCDEKHIKVERELDPGIGKLMVDKNGIHRCIMNFISNSMDALSGGENGRITLRTRMDGGEAEIQIADNGAGIAADKLKKIFDVFFSTKGSKGTGLGLATTKKIINEHGGDVTVQSTEGEGTTFSVRLPARPAS